MTAIAKVVEAGGLGAVPADWIINMFDRISRQLGLSWRCSGCKGAGILKLHEREIKRLESTAVPAEGSNLFTSLHNQLHGISYHHIGGDHLAVFRTGRADHGE